MPEPSELEAYARNLEGRFKDRILESIEVVVHKKLNVYKQDLQQQLEGQRLHNVIVDGRSLQFRFRRGRVMNLHLMISGQVKILEPGQKTEFPIVIFRFQGGDGFALTDPKRQAALVLSRTD